LDAVNTAAASAFAVSSAGNAAISVNSVAVSGKTVTLTLSRTVTSAETVTVSYTKPTTGNDTNAIQDAAGNDAASFAATAVQNSTSAADTTPPVLITTGDHRPKVTGNQLTLTYTDASNLDAVNTAAASAFAVSSAGNAAISVNSVAVSGKTVTLTLSRTVTSAETVTLSYTKPTGDNVIQDAAGNDAVSFSNQAVTHGTSAVGGTRPTLAATNPITIADNKLSIGESTTVTIRFAEAIVTDSFTTADLIVGGSATLSNDLQSTDGGITWTVTLKAPESTDLRGDPSQFNSTGNQIRVNLAGVTNPAGNAGVGQVASTVTYDIDVFPPGAIVRLIDRALTAGETTTVTFSFSEPVVGFTAANIDLTQANGTLGPLTALTDGRTWTATFTPTANTNALTNSISINHRGVTDLAGNRLTASTSSSSNYTINTQPGSTDQTTGLSASVTLTDSRLTTGEKATVIIAFNKPVNEFTLDDIDLTQANGRLSDFTPSADGRTWTATFTPTAGVINGTNTISVNLTGVTYAAGTAGIGRVTSTSFIVNTALPAARITLTDTALTAGETTTVTFTFNQTVLGFTMEDIDLTQANGTLSPLVYTPNTDNKTWTATFTPNADVSDATNTIRVNLTGVTNVAGRSSIGRASSENYTVDTRPLDTTPPVLITTGDSGPKVTGNQLTLTYTDASNLDAVNTAAASAFAVSSAGNAAISVNSVAVSGKTVTLTLSRAVASAETTVTVSYTKPTSGNNVIQDAASNDAVSFSNQAVTHGTSAADTTPPVLITTGNSGPKVNGNQLTLTYTDASNLDAVNTAAASAFAVSSAGNAAISVNSVAVSGKTVTLTLSRTVATAETVTVSYTKPTTGNDTNAIQDAAGNDAASFAATAVQNSTSAADTTPPVLITTGAHRPKVTGNQLTLTYTDASNLDAVNTAAASAFAVSSAGNAAISVNSVAVSGKTVTLTLSRTV
ncbi:beta strand repeat-containing protein, partial [Verminephrobacter aporrectodeae]|uniref:beta strand repeat-containing protein n=2 Tax=Verminephrobacter aporrectodeae TaxID=1110389 RepID=UPI0022438CCE